MTTAGAGGIMATLLTEADVRRLLTIADAMDVAEAAYRIFGTERDVLSKPSAATMTVANSVPTNFWIKGAHARALGVAGVSLGAQFGEHYFMVTDARTGALRGVVERTFMSKRRTGATAGVTARHLARPDSRIAALVGAGQIGDQAVRAIAHAFALHEFRIASRTLAGAVAFVDRLQPEVNVKLRAMPDAEEAIREADIVVTITVAQAPFVEPGWLKPGALLISMGGVAEIEFGVLAEIDRIIVDDIGYAMMRGDLACWIRDGNIAREALLARVDADIGEVVSGTRAGRRTPGERILAVIQGMTICDLATAHWLITAGERTGVGQHWATTSLPEPVDTAKHQRDSETIAAWVRAGTRNA
jgi:alanine dehydrogenase